MEFSNIDIRKLIFFLWKSGKNSPAVYREINRVLGEGTVSLSTCQRWISRFGKGNYGIKDSQRSGRPSLAIEDQIIECLTLDKYASTRVMAEVIGVNAETVRENLHKMGKRYLVNSWIPHHLTDDNKLRRRTVCEHLLEMYQDNDFLMQLITVDEVWIYWENDQRSYLNRSWVTPGGDGVTSVRTTSMTTKKHMVSVFWDAHGILLVDVLSTGAHINAEKYCQQLEKMKQAVYEKRRCASLTDFYFLQDNARSHTAYLTKKKLQELQINVLEHPPYSPDLSPSDFYLFSPMKLAVHGKKYDNASDIMNDIHEWFNSKNQKFYSKAFELLPTRWEKCVKANGDYFQHLADCDE